MTDQGFGNTQLVAATYARVSGKGQEGGISLDDQESRMLAYAAQQQIVVPQDYRFREIYSGLKEERPEYEKIRQLIRERNITVLLVYSSDRHTRDEVHGAIFDAELRRSKCQLHIVTRGGEVDIYSANGRLLNTIERAFSKHWAYMIMQTTQDKKQAYTKQGIPLQQGFAPYGYRRVGRQWQAQLEIVEEEAQVIRRIFEWYAEGVPTKDMAERLRGTPSPGDLRRPSTKKFGYGVWSAGVVTHIVRDEIYAGVYYANKTTTVEGVKQENPKEEWIAIEVPAIVSRELWERCQERLARAKRDAVRRNAKYDYLCTRLATCRLCGYSIFTSVPNPNMRYYVCNSKHHRLVRGKCSLPHMRVDVVDTAVWTFTTQLLEDPQAMLAAMREAQREQRQQQTPLLQRVAELEELIAEKDLELAALVRDYRKAKGTKLFEVMEREANQVIAQIDGLKREKERLEVRLQEQLISDDDIATLEHFAAQVRGKLPHATFAEKRAIVEALHFRFAFTAEDQEKVVYVIWYVHEFRLHVGRVRQPCRRCWPDASQPLPPTNDQAR